MHVLSVVMPVHNALPHLDKAIESILSQTFRDFEFLILDDASTDGSSDRLRHWAALDPRIRLISADHNLGPVGSSNMVASTARGPFVARMDADDISYPDRLSKQLRLLHEQPDIGVVASLCDIIDVSGRKVRDPEIWRLARRSVFVPFAHGAMMYRRDVFERVGGYRKECEYWEDQDLVLRMAAETNVAVIPEALYCVRQSTTSTRVASEQERLERAVDLMYRSMTRTAEGGSYDDLLAQPVPEKLDPRVFVAVGSVHLWSSGRPRLFRRFLRRARLSFDSMTLAAALWTLWASISPQGP